MILSQMIYAHELVISMCQTSALPAFVNFGQTIIIIFFNGRRQGAREVKVTGIGGQWLSGAQTLGIAK